MEARKASLAVLLLLVLIVGAHASGAVRAKRVMPWMCLERCGDTLSDIFDQLGQIEGHQDLVSGVSFEKYNLGPGSSLVLNDLADVGRFLTKMPDLETFPMISSYPYPPEFIDWCRYLFKNPQPFITACINDAKKFGYTGYNVDFEPATGSTADDAIAYGAFLNTFADALHREGMVLTVDIASWSPFWNWTLIGSSRVDRVMLMSTYATSLDTFRTSLLRAVQQIGLSKLAVGMMTVKGNTNEPYTDAELEPRFQIIRDAGVKEIAIWRMGIPDNWWKFIRRFVTDN